MTSAAPERAMPAADGGTPVRTAPFAPWPFFDEDEIAAVTRVLESGCVNYWTGSECAQFEQAYAQLCGRRHAIALVNGQTARVSGDKPLSWRRIWALVAAILLLVLLVVLAIIGWGAFAK